MPARGLPTSRWKGTHPSEPEAGKPPSVPPERDRGLEFGPTAQVTSPAVSSIQPDKAASGSDTESRRSSWRACAGAAPGDVDGGAGDAELDGNLPSAPRAGQDG